MNKLFLCLGTPLIALILSPSASAAYQSAYYESFAGIELAAGSLANPSGGVGIYSGNATNIAVAGDKVYFQDGVNIYSANPDLSGVTLFHTNGVAPTDLAVYVAATVPEPATWALMVAGAGLHGACRRRKTNQAR